GNFDHKIEIRDNRRAEYEFDIRNMDFPLNNSERGLEINNAKVAGTLSFGDVEILEALNYDYKSLLSKAKLLVAAEIGELSYPYSKLSNVKTDLLYENNKANLKLNVSDPKANLLAEGDVYLAHVLPIIDGKSNEFEKKEMPLSDNAASSHIKISIPEIQSSIFGADRHGVSVMSADNIDLQYNDLHDFNVVVDNFSCYNNDKAIIEGDNFNLRCGNDGSKINYNFKSNDFEGNVVTNMDLREIPNVFLAKVFGCIPALDNHKSKGSYSLAAIDDEKSDVNLKLKIGRGSFVSKLLSDKVDFEEPVYVDAQFGGSQERDVVTVLAPKLTVGSSKYDNASMYFFTEKDSLGGMLMTTKYFGDVPVRLESRFNCADNQLCNNLTWKNLNAPTGGRFSTQTKFERLNAGGLVTDTKILPTSFVVNDTVWQISPSEVYYGDNIFKINNFRLSRQKQFVNLNADITNEKRDILLELNDVEVAYLLDLVGFKPVEFSGRADGTIRNIPETKNIGADIKVKNFCFNTGPMGILRADVLYNADDGKINIDAKTQASPEDSTLINGYVNVADNTLDLHIKSEKTNLQFLNKFVRRFISDLEGNTSGDLRLFGDLRDVNIEGDHCVNYMKFRPTILGVMYSFENDSLHLRPDTIDLSGMTLRDPFGNYAKIKGSINHHFLYNFDYNFDFSLTDLQIINWEEEPSRSFWGNIFTSGNIGIGGTFSKVNIGGELTPSGPLGSSVLNYNSETTSLDEENKEYVSFVSRDRNLGKIQSEKQDETLKKDNSTDVYMNFKFNINPSATLNIITDPITHDNMSLSGGGPIRMSYYNKGKFELNGQYIINEGNYKLTIKDIIRRNFTIRPGGYLRFNGSPSDGELNITGVHKINSVSLSDLNVGATQSNSTIGADCILYFTGKASEPKVSFGLDFPNANPDESRIVKNFILTEEDKNMQAVYLLSIGRFYTYNYNEFNTTGRSQSSVAMTSFLAGTLSGQINSLFQDAFHVDNWSFDTNIAAGRMGFDDMEVQGSLSGRMFNNRLLFNGNIGYRDQMTTYSNNFVGNFNIQWFLNKTGSVSLKAYSETNDRYFTKSSLTTQGGGILFKKDFNRFKNFFIRQRKKK
ncbi:MAG: translocation/assembly module TamB domain-containing protein, partial [Bacteroidaceae bacterium]